MPAPLLLHAAPDTRCRRRRCDPRKMRRISCLHVFNVLFFVSAEMTGTMPALGTVLCLVFFTAWLAMLFELRNDMETQPARQISSAPKPASVRQPRARTAYMSAAEMDQTLGEMRGRMIRDGLIDQQTEAAPRMFTSAP